MAQVGSLILTASDIHDVTSEKQHVLGAVAQTRDGRLYRYAKNGAAALEAGDKVGPSATTAATSTVDGAVRAAGTFVKVDDAVTSSNAPKYEDGILTVAGARYLVQGVNGKVISLAERVSTPIADGVATSLAANPFCGVVEDSDGTGTAEVAVPAGAYFWAAYDANAGVNASIDDLDSRVTDLENAA